MKKTFLLMLLSVFCSLTLQAAQQSPKAHHEKTVDATAPYDRNNVFAKILRGEAPANIVYEDEYALAFHTIDPKVNVHILVIPKGPYTNFMRFAEQASAQEQIGLINAIRKVSELMGVSDNGFRLNTNTGHHGGQTVPHLHFHVLGGEPVPGMKDKVAN